MGMRIQKKVHGVIAGKQRANYILSIEVEGDMVKGVEGVRGAIHGHISMHF